jgi:hypothetical protein
MPHYFISLFKLLTLAYRIVQYLKPLAIANNIAQGAICRPDDVLLIFGYLSVTFGRMIDPVDADARQTVLLSLEKRWRATDQLVFIAATFLNPYIKFSPFNTSLPFFSQASIVAALNSLYMRFFGFQPPDGHLDDEYESYLGNKGPFQLLQTQCNQISARAAAKVIHKRMLFSLTVY